MVPVAVVVAVVGGDFFVGPLNDLVAQSHRNNFLGQLLQIGRFL